MTDEELRAKNRSEEIAFGATMRQDFERQDERFGTASSARDWLILIVIAAVQFAWMLVVFLVEPGIR